RRGLFQTMYEPPSSLTSLLPLTFEWSLAALLLAPAGIIAGGWFWLLTVPLLATWAMCVNGALKAPIDKRFTGFKARSLVALLIYLGPLLRGWERLKWRFKTMQTQDHVGLAPVEQRARIDWLARAFTLSYWNEFSGEKEALLAGLMDFLLPQKYFVVPDTGWSKWDLKISRGLWSRAFITVCAENHGGPKRLLRVRCAMRMSSLARELLKPWPLQIVIDYVLGGKSPAIGGPIGSMLSLPPPVLLVVACAGIVVVHLGAGALTLLHNYTTIRVGQNMVNDLRSDLYAHL